MAMLYYSRHARVSTALGQWITSVTPPTQALWHRSDVVEGACDQGVRDAPAALPPPFPHLSAPLSPLGRDASGMVVLLSRSGEGDACACAVPWS